MALNLPFSFWGEIISVSYTHLIYLFCPKTSVVRFHFNLLLPPEGHVSGEEQRGANDEPGA